MGTSNISLLGVAKLPSAPGANNPRYSTGAHSSYKYLAYNKLTVLSSPCLSRSGPVCTVIRIRNLDSHSSRQQVTSRIPHEMPAPYPGNILASIRAERRGCRSHWSFIPVGHYLSPTFSHLWTHSKARRGSACPQGTPHLHQPISWTSTRPFLEASSWSSTWQVDRPVPKR